MGLDGHDSSALQKLVPLLQHTNSLLEQLLATAMVGLDAWLKRNPEVVVKQGLLGWPADGVQKCEAPPAGWTCSRPKGHQGPCAASRVTR